VNKEKSIKEYEESQKKLFHVAKHKSARFGTTNQEAIEAERKRMIKKTVKLTPNFNPVQIKLTTAAILKRELLLKRTRIEEEKQLEDFSIGIRDETEFRQWQQDTNNKEKMEIQMKLERKRLEVKLLHEDAFVAKQELIKNNKEKAFELVKEKNKIMAINEKKMKILDQANKKKVAYVQEIKNDMKDARDKIILEKTKNATGVSNESKRLLKEIYKKKNEDMIEKHNLIQQIKNMEKQTKFKKPELDFTTASNVGLLSEMSLIEV
jgi:hypothetical protein